MQCFKNFFPSVAEMWAESKKLWQLAWPVALSGVLYVLPNQIHLSVLGHSEANHHNIAALTLAGSFMNMTVSTFASGFAGAIATLGGQAFGKKSYRVIGLVLQKTMMLLTLFCIPLMTLFFFAEKFFNMLNQDPTVSHLAGHYCRFNMLAIWPGLNFQALLIFLQCQGIVLLDLYVNIFVNIVNAALSYFLIIYWGWGIDGVVAADIFNAWLFFFSLLFLIWWNGIHKETIPPPSCEIFKSWGNIFCDCCSRSFDGLHRDMALRDSAIYSGDVRIPSTGHIWAVLPSHHAPSYIRQWICHCCVHSSQQQFGCRRREIRTELNRDSIRLCHVHNVHVLYCADHLRSPNRSNLY